MTREGAQRILAALEAAVGAGDACDLNGAGFDSGSWPTRPAGTPTARASRWRAST